MRIERLYNMVISVGTSQGDRIYFNNLKDYIGLRIYDLQAYPYLNPGGGSQRGPSQTGSLGPIIPTLNPLLLNAFTVSLYKGNTTGNVIVDIPLAHFVFNAPINSPLGFPLTKKTWRTGGLVNFDQSYVQYNGAGVTAQEEVLIWNIIL